MTAMRAAARLRRDHGWTTSPVGRPPGYERATLLGRGGTATVYSARPSDSMHVAIKVFDAPDSSAFDRQQQAADRLSGIDGIAEVIEEAVLPDGRGCLVFPSLRRVVGRPDGPIRPDRPGRVAHSAPHGACARRCPHRRRAAP